MTDWNSAEIGLLEKRVKALEGKVSAPQEPPKRIIYAEEITYSNYKSNKKAFIGCIVDRVKSALYLVTYDAVVDTNNFEATYSGRVGFIIEEWVDVRVVITGHLGGDNGS